MLKRNGVYAALALALALASATPAFAQSTSAAVAGRVTSVDGKSVPGATVEIVHQPSGTKQTLTTDAEGRYSTRGLRVGGPYTVTTTAPGMEPSTQNDVFLLLDEVSTVNLVVGGGEATALEGVTVVAASSDTTFSTENMGAGTNVTNQQIQAFPTIRRSLEDYVRFDPRIVQVDKERGGISAGGQNNRYNNVKVDGVPTNDQFGLNDSGLPSLNQPISIDWIQEFNIGVSNYDVTQTDFVGANINAVTKSGGNDFHGSVYGVYRNNDMVGDDDQGNEFKGFDDEWTAGTYVSGPIVEDTLFFFVGYEKFERSAPGASTCITGESCVNQINISQAELDQIRAIAAANGLPDIGGQSRTADNTDEKWFAKLDWNINENHRATFRYNKTEGEALRLNTSTTTLQLDSNYYQDNISFENYALLFYDNWSDIFSTEANISYAEYRSLPTPFSLFPQISVTVRPGASVLFGRERSRHANELAVDTWTAFFAGDLFLGDHTLKFGFDYEGNDVFNLFLQDLYGNYSFASIADFNNLRYSNYSLQQPRNGDINSVAANFEVNTTGVFLQDTWAVTPNLTMQLGFRVDRNEVPDEPPFNAAAFAAFGVDNQNTIDGQTTFQPRFGFNYQFDTELRTQLRGGFGLFQGSAPGVWISNSFSNPGGLAIAYSAQNGTGATFDPNNPLIPTTTNAAQLVNFLSDDFQQPTVWKMNLAFDKELPWWGLVAGFEYLKTSTEKGVEFKNLNLGAPSGVLPDGRNSYFANTTPANFLNNRTPTTRVNRNTAFTDVILLENTDEGHAEQYTVTLEKPFENGWYSKIGYTYSNSEEISPATSSVALSNWQNVAVFNPNDLDLATANYQLRNRFTGQFSKTWNWFDNAQTSFAVFYEARNGRPYSYVFSGDANGDGRTFNDLFTVPGVDAIYSTNSTQADIDAFLSYIESNEDLADNRGEVLKRNLKSAPWVHQFDVRLSQQIPFFADTHAELFLDILNFGNLLNEDWGNIDEAVFPYTIGVARMAGVQDGQYVYDVSNYVNESTGAVTNPTLIRKDVAGESRWSVQVGFRFEF